MDIFAHGMWAWAGAEALRRRGHISKRTLATGVALAVMPDLVHMMPVLAAVVVGQLSVGQLLAYATARPGLEPILPPWVAASAHHLHCSMHSVLLLGAVSLAAWYWQRWLLYPLLGWWLHIVTDVPTHSAAYYAVPLFYPISYRGFNGLAWTTPGLIAINYLGLAGVAVWLYRTRERPESYRR